jgi:hypothetical protein
MSRTGCDLNPHNLNIAKRLPVTQISVFQNPVLVTVLESLLIICNHEAKIVSNTGYQVWSTRGP